MKKTQILHNYQANLRKNRREQIKKEHRRKETIVRTDRTERRTDKDITRSEDRTEKNNKSNVKIIKIIKVKTNNPIIYKLFKDFTNHRKKTNRAVVFSCRPFSNILKYRDH